MKRIVTAIISATGLAGLLIIGAAAHRGVGGGANLLPDVRAQDGERQPQARPARCTAADVKGSYGYSATGTALGVGQFAAVGRITAHADGTLSGSITQSVNGLIIPASAFTGTYTVNADCTGAVELSRGGPADFVIVDRGRELHFIQTTPGTTITGVIKRQ